MNELAYHNYYYKHSFVCQKPGVATVYEALQLRMSNKCVWELRKSSVVLPLD